TLLLVFEAIDSGKITLKDTVTVSEHAAKMGGSQVYLEAGEQMSVEDLIKSVVICSANDAATALGEYVAGSESAFVDAMNEKALLLGMKNTHFDNTNGLDDTTQTHLTSARDIALMSRELIVNHPAILQYTTLWQDSIRNGEFILTNTNKLIRFYPGANGLKTGFTQKSGYCISATAERDGLQLIAVVMGAESSNARNVAVKELFDYGFATYTYERIASAENIDFSLTKGKKSVSYAKGQGFGLLIEKNQKLPITAEYSLKEGLEAPIIQGDVVGEVVYKMGDTVIRREELRACETVDTMRFFDVLWGALRAYFMME
ncbi:MAG: D-alanyl-D-alanine carboxypeptidase, partial [Clostridia bacterium]|nr:D-alanyl-D-alanine carboxypeptidase [Clostridia bacterium]